jgi:hypothetical protein
MGSGEDTRKQMAQNTTLIIPITRSQSMLEQNEVENAEWEFHHDCLQVRLPQSEKQDAVRAGHADKEWGPRHH